MAKVSARLGPMRKVAHTNVGYWKWVYGQVGFEPCLLRLAFFLGKLLVFLLSSSCILVEVGRGIFWLDPSKFKLVLSRVGVSWVLQLLNGWFLYLWTRVNYTWSVNGCRLFERLVYILWASVDRPIWTRVVSDVRGQVIILFGFEVSHHVILELLHWHCWGRWPLLLYRRLSHDNAIPLWCILNTKDVIPLHKCRS